MTDTRPYKHIEVTNVNVLADFPEEGTIILNIQKQDGTLVLALISSNGHTQVHICGSWDKGV